jgi:hexosaminidase
LRLLDEKDGAREIAVEARDKIGEREEGYWLDVPGDGSGAVLRANSTLGLFRGLNTFAQLWWSYDYRDDALDHDGDRDGVVVYTLSAPVAIQDSPAYVSQEGNVLFYHYSWMLTWEGDSHIAGSCWTQRGICE